MCSEQSLKAARQSNRNLDKIFNEKMFDEVEMFADDYVESPYAWEPEAVAAAAAVGAQIIEIDVPDSDIAWLEKVMSGQPEAHSEEHVEHAKVTWAREAADGGPVAVPFGTNIYKMAQQGLLKLRGQAELLPQPGASSSSESNSSGDRNEFVKGAEERSDEVTALYAAIMENKKAAKAAAAAAAAASGSSSDSSDSEPRVNGHANGHTLQNGAASGIANSKPGWFARVFKGEKSSDEQQQQHSSSDSSSSSGSNSTATTPVSVDSNHSWATAADTTEQQQQQQQLTVTQAEAQSLDRELTDYEEASFDAYDFIMVHRDDAGSVADAARASNRLDSADEQAAFEAAFASIGISDSSPK
jgi:hypothetical protein